MKVRDLEGILVSRLDITFGEDVYTNTPDIIVPLSTENLSDILGEFILDREIYLMRASEDALTVSVFSSDVGMR